MEADEELFAIRLRATAPAQARTHGGMFIPPSEKASRQLATAHRQVWFDEHGRQESQDISG